MGVAIRSQPFRKIIIFLSVENKMLNIKNKRVRDKYEKFYLEHGYLPKYFDIYNGIEIVDIAPCITTASNGSMGSGTLLIIEEKLE